MSMISYAQNYEDVILWRALRNVPNGRYIDVGAWDPIYDSVTKWFYDNNWMGINIEPNVNLWQRLQNLRPRDTNLCVAAGDHDAEAILHLFKLSGLSTLDTQQAKLHANHGIYGDQTPVLMKTLTTICDEYDFKDIHFLKIDAEGYEEKVLKGLDLTRIRPWIILVETVNVETRYMVITNQEAWSQITHETPFDEMLLKHNYHKVYVDGINAFFLANERKELGIYFQYPPNVFDQFTLKRHIDLERQLAEVRESAKSLENEVADMRASTSWKVSKPVRIIGKFTKHLLRLINK